VAVLVAQSPASDPRFEVASIRPVESGDPSLLDPFGPPLNGTVRMPMGTLRRLMNYAYDINIRRHDPAIEGGPDWMDQDLFAVVAQGPPDLTLPRARRMLQTLLRDRFNLKARVEKRERPVYALVVARQDGRLGPGLKPSSIDCGAYSDTLDRTGRGALATEAARGAKCGLLSGGGFGPGRLGIRGTATMREMILPLSRSPDVDRKIVDRTGLTGTFDIDFMWAPARTGANAARPEDVVSVFTALQEQLGLELDSRREPLDVVVIESVERPPPD
jgi:uncharacterized protein (TIGR03435 family)